MNKPFGLAVNSYLRPGVYAQIGRARAMPLTYIKTLTLECWQKA